MLQLGTLYGCIASDIDEAARIFRDELLSDQSFISDHCRHIDQFHGKQLRPAILLLSARACGSLTREHHVLAAVVEMVHIATLVHDDVLDGADIRRRAATVNRLWGNGRAVLLGDFLFSHAYHLCSSLSDQFAARMIAHTAVTVCEGEMMQNAFRENWELSERDYIDIITRKTAGLIGTCALLGARYAEAGERAVRRMSEFGVALGVAFQITDDVLDLNGEEAEAGKSLGRDVHLGKLTLPLIHALRTGGPQRRAALLGLVQGDDPQRYRQVARVLSETGSIEFANQVASEYVASAREILADLPLSEARTSLETMAEFVLSRRG